MTTPMPDSIKLCDLLDSYYHVRGSRANYNSAVFASIRLTAKKVEVKVSFDVTYDPNGATGTAQKITYDNLAATAATKPAGWTDKAGHTFLGWAKSAGATTADYAAGAALTNINGSGTPADGGNYTLYAVWKINQYDVTINYNKNTTGNPTGMPSSSTTKVNYNATFSGTAGCLLYTSPSPRDA